PRLGAAPSVMGGGGGGTSVENSAISRNSFHSPEPSTCILLRPLTRPSATHWRTCSAGIGPYSFPSAPMILYINLNGRKWPASSSFLQECLNADSCLTVLHLEILDDPGHRLRHRQL